MSDDTAWFNRAYGELFGGRLTGARMPLVRGETGIDNQMYRVIGCIDGYRKSAAKLSPT